MEEVTIGAARLYRVEALTKLAEIVEALDVDAIITDPPYSSGGQFRSDRTARTVEKYVNSAYQNRHHSFSGDNKDQRAFYAWYSLVCCMLYQATHEGSVFYTFTDWRQLPIMSDAVQAGGFVWRNLITWWKPGSRMIQGRFGANAEYILACSNGVPKKGEHTLQNVLRHTVVPTPERVHQAEKPVPLIQDLVKVTPPECTVLDPFMGGGTTGVAAVMMGREFIGIEMDGRAFEAACVRIEAAQSQGDLVGYE